MTSRKPTARTLVHRGTVAEVDRLRDLTEDPDPAVRHRATLELIAQGHYLAYRDAQHAAMLALSGAIIEGRAA